MTTWRAPRLSRAAAPASAASAVDALSALLLGVLATLLQLEPGWPSFTLVWMIGALALRSRVSQRAARPLSGPRPGHLTPPLLTLLGLALLSLGLDLALLLALREWSHWPLMALLNGCWALSMLLARRTLAQPPELAIGVFDNHSRSRVLPPLSGAPLRYQPVRAHSGQPLEGIDVLLYEDELRSEEYRRLIAHASATGLPVWSRTALEEAFSGKVLLEAMNTQWTRSMNFQSGYAPFKRLLDVVFTVLLLPVLAPLLLAVALLVWTDGRRPVLFWQERIGRGGVPFRLVKFRTMRTDSERSGPAFAAAGDVRVTPLGAVLRKYRLDELPQFWNVLRGEMSIIGPRPEQFAFAADFEESIPLYPLRHWVRPGISGWAQVNQGYAADLGQTVEKLRYDLYYVKHLSPGLDAVVVVKTLHTILSGFGAR